MCASSRSQLCDPYFHLQGDAPLHGAAPRRLWKSHRRYVHQKRTRIHVSTCNIFMSEGVSASVHLFREMVRCTPQQRSHMCYQRRRTAAHRSHPQRGPCSAKYLTILLAARPSASSLNPSDVLKEHHSLSGLIFLTWVWKSPSGEGEWKGRENVPAESAVRSEAAGLPSTLSPLYHPSVC